MKKNSSNKRIKYNSFVLIVFVMLFNQGLVWSQIKGEDHFYKDGNRFLSSGDTLKAYEYFLESIKNGDNPQSYFQLGKLSAVSRDIDKRLNTKFYFDKAINNDPDNINYRFEYAQYLERLSKLDRSTIFSRVQAYEQYEQIIKIDSNYSPAYYRIGYLKYEDFLEYNGAFQKTVETPVLNYNNFYGRSRSEIIRKQWESQFEPMFGYEKVANDVFNVSETYLKKAIEIDKNNFEAIKTLAFLYEDANQDEKGIELLKTILRESPRNSDILLHLGLLYYKIFDYENAYKSYQKALVLMKPEEKEIFTVHSVKILLSSLIKENLGSLDSTKLKSLAASYWYDKDPLLLTKYNERLIEHYSRVVYANLRFGVESKKKKGWETDRGEILIRYGFPLERKKLKSWMHTMVPGEGSNSIHRLNVTTDIWIYSDFELGFIDPFLTNEFVFNELGQDNFFHTQYGVDTKLLVEKLRFSNTDEYYPKFKNVLLDVPYITLQFRNGKDNSKTDVYVNYLIRRNDSLSNIEDNKLIEGLFYFDDNFNKIHSHQDTIIINNKVDNIYSIKFSSKEGSGNLALEIIRKADDGIAAYHGKFNIKDYSNDELMLSDFVLARSVDFELFKGKINRGNLSIISSPSNIFNKNEPIFIYYEIYNLGIDEEKLTNFDQEISIRIIEEDSSIGNILNKVGEVLGIGKEGEKITLTSNYKTLERDPQIYFQLDMGKYESGEYEIEVKIKDKVKGKEISGKTLIKWINE